ncbi:GNAT family N-acetyltransferase [Luteimicrobium sp. NPDC057192]|uniref:GNAT family N-acetyltransferase n=1 Tax=Luteimicrobium sp. NPDC057192 TaxID=3346042 RepID=UPI0036341FFA
MRSQAALNHDADKVGVPTVWEVVDGVPHDDPALESEWEALAVRRGAPRSAPSCVLPWYRFVLAEPARARIVVARRDGRVVGIWPLFHTRDTWGFVTYRMAGHQTIVGVEPLAVRDDIAAKEALVAGLAGLRPVPDRVELECVEDPYDWLGAARAAFPSWRAQVRTDASRAPFFELDDETYSTWVEHRRTGGGKSVRRYTRRLADHGYHPRRFTEPAEIVARLPALRRLYLARKAARGGWGADFDDAMLAMVSDVVASLVDGERVVLYSVERDADDVAAVDLVLVAGNSANLWIGGIGDVLPQYSPGQVNLTAIIDDSHAAGLRILSLGPGEEDYKSRYSTGAQDVVAAALVRHSRSLTHLNTPATFLPSGARDLARQLKARVKRS